MAIQGQSYRFKSWASIHWLFRVLSLVLLVAFSRQVNADAAAPINIPTSQPSDWDGNDGPWSTFNFKVGYHNQSVRLLPAFHQGHMTVVAREGCPDSLGANCSIQRGGVFDPRIDVWWDFGTQIWGNKTSPFVPGQTSAKINSTVSVVSDTTIKLRNQSVLLTQSMDPFVGLVGLGADVDNTLMSGQSTFLESAMGSSNITVRAFSYTAGVATANAPGSLLIGGYDQARFLLNTSRSFPMTMDPKKRFAVNLLFIDTVYGNKTRSITTVSNNTTEIQFVIDPITPYIWLPADTLKYLEAAMGLVWDAPTQLYLLPSNQFLLPDLYFSLSNATLGSISSSSSSTSSSGFYLRNSTLVLNATYPLSNKTDPAQYVPFKPGPYPGNGAYTLGRAFLQSTHIIANYEISTFTLAQAHYDPSDGSKRVGLSKDSAGPPKTTDTSYPYYGGTYYGDNLSLSLVIALSVLGALLVGLVIYGLVAYRKGKWPFKHRKKGKEDDDYGDILRTAKAELDGSTSGTSSKVVSSTEVSEISEVEGSSVPRELRGIEIVQAELDGDTPYYELDARPKSVDWGKKEDPGVTVRRILARPPVG